MVHIGLKWLNQADQEHVRGHQGQAVCDALPLRQEGVNSNNKDDKSFNY